MRVDASGNRVSNAITIKGLWFAGVMHMLVDIVPPRTPAGNARRMRAQYLA